MHVPLLHRKHSRFNHDIGRGYGRASAGNFWEQKRTQEETTTE
jgi:hypothetical protein